MMTSSRQAANLSDGVASVIACKISGWDEDRHWSGEKRISAVDLEYPLWRWLLQNRDVLTPLVSEPHTMAAASVLLGLGRLSSITQLTASTLVMPLASSGLRTSARIGCAKAMS
jgi:hypothetical protein